MKAKNIFFNFLGFISIILTVFIMVFWSIYLSVLNKERVFLQRAIIEHTERLENCEEYSLFKQAKIKIGNRKWDEDNYNCIDFSIDLVEELKKAGIKSSVAIGEERTHAWILVWIEATTGEFILAETDLEILEIRNEKMKVICD